MFERISRNFVGLLFWLIVAAGCIFINCIVALANYMGCRTSLALLGYEMQPLFLDRIFGDFFRTFLGKATMADLYAVGLTLTLEFGIFVLLHLAFDAYSLYFDRRICIRKKDEKGAETALQHMVMDLALVIIFGVAVFFAIKWDMGLFRYRSSANALGIENPQVATSTVKAWKVGFREQIQFFAWHLARYGAWGYIAVTAIASMGIEFSFVKLSEFWSRLCSTFTEIGDPNQPGTGGNRHSDDPRISNHDKVDPSGQETDLHRQFAAAMARDSSKPGLGDDSMGSEPGRSGQSADSVDVDELREVIGEERGERVSIVEAMSNPRYWVDPETGDIWNAEVHEELIQQEKQKPKGRRGK